MMFSSLALTILALLPLATSSPFDITKFPLSDWLRDSLVLNLPITCPMWKGPLPSGTYSSQCFPKNSKTFTRANMNTKATLYQSDESWQTNPKKDQFLATVEEGINKGLDLFGTHAGTAAKPLQIYVTVVNTLYWHDVLTDTDNGVDSPCYIVVNFNGGSPMLKFKKDIVRNMYHCVQQYYHPNMKINDGTEWWWEGTARFVDGMAWPATKDILRLHDGEFPEEFIGQVPLFQHDETSSLFWHSVNNHGWSIQDVTNWIKNHRETSTYDDERANMASDAKLKNMWHPFGQDLVAGNIRYPARKIDMSGVNYSQKVYNIVALNPGQESHQKFDITSWEVVKAEIPFGEGQTLDIWMEDTPGVEWSYRKKDTGAWTKGVRGQKYRIVVPSGCPQCSDRYEVVLTYVSAQHSILPDLYYKRV